MPSLVNSDTKQFGIALTTGYVRLVGLGCSNHLAGGAGWLGESKQDDLGGVTAGMGDGETSESEDIGRETTRVQVDVVRYDVRLGVGTFWDENARLQVEVQPLGDEQLVVVAGNRAGLRSLARHLLTLAQEDVPDGRHLDFDWYGLPGSGSTNLRIEIGD
jgi:hypothetical protein